MCVDHTGGDTKQRAAIPSTFLGGILYHLHQCVECLTHAFKTIILKVFKKWIRQNRAIIRKMDDQASVDIETDKLKSLCDIAEKHGGAAKTSGAGGGDCGITIIHQNVDKQRFTMNG